MAKGDGSQRFDRDGRGTEVSGRAIGAIVTGVGQYTTTTERTTATRLADAGLPRTPEPEAWYPLTGCLRVIDTLLVELGSAAVERIGEGLVAVVAWPGPVDAIPDAMETLGAYHERSHRGDAGTLSFERTGPVTGRMRCRTPYPCPLERGMVRGVARHAGTGLVTVTEAGHCRTDGSDACTYEISWQDAPARTA